MSGVFVDLMGIRKVLESVLVICRMSLMIYLKVIYVLKFNCVGWLIVI